MRPRSAACIGGVAFACAIAPLTIALYNHVHFPAYHPYLPALTSALETYATELVRAAWPLAGMAGLFAIHRSDERAIVAGAALAPLVSLAISPVASDVARIAVVPLIPVAACGIAALLSRPGERIRVPLATAS